MIQNVRIGRIYNGSAGDVILQSKIVNPSNEKQVITPDGDFQGLSSVTVNAIPVVNLSTPEIDINEDGLIVSSVSQPEGYVIENMKSNSLQLDTQAATIINPTLTDTIISKGKYLTGDITVKGDSNLIPENIKKGVNLFGVIGTHKGGEDGEVNLFQGLISRNFSPPINLTPADFGNITKLGYSAFGHQDGINSVELPETVQMLDGEAFYSTKIKKIILPSSIITYSGNCFGGAATTEEIVIKSTTKIPSDAFNSWFYLRKIDLTYLNEMLESDSFFQSTQSSCKLYFKAGLYNDYSTSIVWSKFTLCPQGYYIPSIKDKTIILSISPETTLTVPIIGNFTNPSITFNDYNGTNLTISNSLYNPPTNEQNIGSLTFTITGQTESNNTIRISINDGTNSLERTFNVNILADITPSTWSVEDVPNATYNFVNNGTYYQNTNQNIDDSFAICKVNISSNGISTMLIDYLQSSESGFDFGLISKLDTELNLDANVDSNDKLSLNLKSISTTIPQTFNFDVVPQGNHFIYIKYRKDGSTANGTDTFQFNIRFE